MSQKDPVPEKQPGENHPELHKDEERDPPGRYPWQRENTDVEGNKSRPLS
jgi:hypothetical protein